ncbi:MAG: site-2 protease family protein [bacterium]|nr:site-2 protease family protein [bacterium]
MFSDPIGFLYFLVALLITLTVHEASHALVAYYLGDPTAKMKGRLTLNPIAHLDAAGSIIFLITQRIGWGKPVPVNPANFKHPVRDSALTALAGPMSNFILAFFVALPWKYLGEYMPEPILIIVQYTFHVSIFLGIFNLFPFPPLDGSKILGLIIPKRFHRQYENYLYHGMKYFVAIILIDVFILGNFFDFSFFAYAMGYLHDKVSVVLLLGT